MELNDWTFKRTTLPGRLNFPDGIICAECGVKVHSMMSACKCPEWIEWERKKNNGQKK